MKRICYIKKLTPAEVGATKAHVGAYLRLPNDFDFTAFFQQKGQDNNGVIEIFFDAINCNNGKCEQDLRFAYFKNSNTERRIPNLATLFEENGVCAGDVVKLESYQNNGSVEFFIHFYKNDNIQTTATNVYYVYSDEGDEMVTAINKNLPLQQIFYGAPGTGKSHTIKEQTKGDDTVIRTTFHPDSDYSTFVGCYKPTMEEEDVRVVPVVVTSGISLDQNNGTYKEKRITYKFVQQAFTKAYIQAWEKMANYQPIDRIFMVNSVQYEIIGISKDSITVKKLSDSDANEPIKIAKSRLKEIYNASDSDNAVEQGVVSKLEGLDQKSFDDAWKVLEKGFLKPQFLIIEEINRGNCAQIFGDLFQLLDRGDDGYSEYPIEADDDLRKELENEFVGLKLDADVEQKINSIFEENYHDGITDKILNGKLLVLPKNLFIWATMNTSDQSLFPIDSAFKRRWDWTYIPIKKSEKDNYKIEVKGVLYDWWSFIDQMNKVVEKATESEDKKMGYYFCKPDKDGSVISAKKFVNKVLFYLYNDVFKDNGLDWDLDGHPIFKYTEDKDKEVVLTFAKCFNPDGSPNEDQVEHLMKNLKVEENSDLYGDSSGFKLDGKDMSLKDIARDVVLNYANNNPYKSAQEIRDYFVVLCKGIGVAHIVETETEYHLRDVQASQERSASEITIPSGDKLYVSTQWRAKNEDDNFIQFLKIVNDNALGIISK